MLETNGLEREYCDDYNPYLEQLWVATCCGQITLDEFNFYCEVMTIA
jgi:hypothetical protein